MFLKEIHVKNLRCFDDVRLSFAEPDGAVRRWTVLLGENGTGKSTLLKAIALVTSGQRRLSDLVIEPEDWVRHGERFCGIEAVLVTKKMEERPLQLRIERDDSRSDIIVRNQDGLDPLNRALDHSTRNYFVVGFGASRRLSILEGRRQKTSNFRSTRAESVATLSIPTPRSTPSSRGDGPGLYVRRGAGIETVRAVLSDFLPGIRFDSIDKKKGRLLSRPTTASCPYGR